MHLIVLKPGKLTPRVTGFCEFERRTIVAGIEVARGDGMGNTAAGAKIQVDPLVMFEQPNMKEAVKYLVNYMVTYDKQPEYLDYDARIYVDDVLYGLGVSLNKKEFSFARGFQKFKKELKRYLDT